MTRLDIIETVKEASKSVNPIVIVPKASGKTQLSGYENGK